MANDKLIYAHVNFYDPPTSAVTEATPDSEESAATIVVRCKDCIFYKETRYPSGNVYFACHKFLTKMTKTDDFCSYGERKTDG